VKNNNTDSEIASGYEKNILHFLSSGGCALLIFNYSNRTFQYLSTLIDIHKNYEKLCVITGNDFVDYV